MRYTATGSFVYLLLLALPVCSAGPTGHTGNSRIWMRRTKDHAIIARLAGQADTLPGAALNPDLPATDAGLKPVARSPSSSPAIVRRRPKRCGVQHSVTAASQPTSSSVPQASPTTSKKAQASPPESKVVPTTTSTVIKQTPTTAAQAPPTTIAQIAVTTSTTPKPVQPSPTTEKAPPAATTKASNTGSGSSSSGGNSDIQLWLDAHNKVRSTHGAVDLTWSNSLEASAQNWANGCKFQHSGGDYGENLFAGSSGFGPADAVGAWVAEEKDYDPSNPTFSHFTQVVWKATTEVGCALATSCPGVGDKYYVCQYNPAGNFIGKFAENVQKN